MFIVFLLAEKKILVTLTQALDSQAKELKSLSETLNHSRESINITREDRFSQYRPLEEHAPSVMRNGQCRQLMLSFLLHCMALLSENTSCCVKYLHAGHKLENFAFLFPCNG